MTRVLNRGNRELIMTSVDNLSPTPEMRLLDVGFGGGLALQLARQRGVIRLFGVDPSIAAVDALRETSTRWTCGAELHLLEGTVEHLPLADSAVDAVISTNTVYFWPDLSRAFFELHRVLAPRGRLVLGFSSSQKLRSFTTVTRHGFLYYEASELVEQARVARFSDVRLIQLDGRDTCGDYNLIAVKG
jgi:ubiquinone/menaquinone biosynthesis C-methylase UbiE